MAKWQALFQPFHPTTWFFYIVTVGVIFVIAILHALLVFNHDFKYKFDMLQFTYQLLLDNGSPRLGDVHTQNLRVYYTILLLCSFVLTASYKGDSLLILTKLFKFKRHNLMFPIFTDNELLLSRAQETKEKVTIC